MAFSKFYDSQNENILPFNGLESSEKIIERLYGIKIDYKSFNLDMKSDIKSRTLREYGNKLFKVKTKFEDLVTISKIYTDSLFKAQSDIEKSYSHGNRSSVLFKMGFYKPCLLEIDLAVKYGYPEVKLHRLFIRKAESFLMLNDFEKAALSFSEALLILDNNDQCISSCKRIECGLKLCQLQQHAKELASPVEMSLNYPIAENNIDANEHILSMSNKVCLKTNKEDGRGIFAVSDIATGDVLAVEDPYTRRLVRDCFLSHCYFCFKHSFNLVPCDGCCSVGFCDDVCQSNAKTQFRHDLECGILTEILSTKSAELGLLAYGMICQTPLDTIQRALLHIDRETDNLTNEIIDSQCYLSALTIETNECQRSHTDLTNRCISSAFLAQCFAKMLLDRDAVVVTDDLVVIITRALCLHLQGLPCNAHSLSETLIPIGGSLEVVSVNYIGNAVYPALSMINHSCSPNVVRVTMGNGQCVLKAIYPIRAGEQVLDNYSFHFATSPLPVRQQELKGQYYFDCCCIACVENWPTFDDQLQRTEELQLICVSCRLCVDRSTLLCSSCGLSVHDKYQHFLRLKSCLSAKMEHLLTKRYREVEEYLLEFGTVLHEIVKPPHILYNQTSEMLKLIWSMTGSYVSYF